MADKHFFDVSVACEIGLQGAVVLEALAYWTRHNAANGKHQRDGKTWVFNSLAAWQKLFPYFSVQQVRRVLTSLQEQGLILVEKENGSTWNRVNWYAITEKGAALLAGQEWRNCAFAENDKCICRKQQMHSPKTTNVEVTSIISSLVSIGEQTISEQTLYNSAQASACEACVPTIEQVRTYCAARGNSIDASVFVAYYAARHWCLDGKPISDWKSLVLLWEARHRETRVSPRQKGFSSFDTDEFFSLAVARGNGELT